MRAAGPVARVTAAESQAYFASRPRAARLGCRRRWRLFLFWCNRSSISEPRLRPRGAGVSFGSDAFPDKVEYSSDGDIGRFPGAVEELRKHMSGLSEGAQRKILGDNARRFLALDA